jgi:hypothetical protein
MKFQIEKPSPSQVAGGIDFEAANREISEVDFAPPVGDWNLTRRRGG